MYHLNREELGIRPGGSSLYRLFVVCCRMEDEKYEEEEVIAAEVVGEVDSGDESPQLPNNLLEFDVELQGSPESPRPSAGWSSPVFQVLAVGASLFMGFYSSADIDDLEQRARHSRYSSCALGFVPEEPDI